MTSQQRSFTLTIAGMSCSSCTANIQNSIHKVREVSEVNINFLTASGQFTLHPEAPLQQGIDGTIKCIESLGYKVAVVGTTRVDMLISGMTCVSCAQFLEKELQKLEGVVSAQVNFATSSGSVTILQWGISAQDVIAAGNAVGYNVSLLHDSYDVDMGTNGRNDQVTDTVHVLEQKDEIIVHRHNFIGALLLTIPLVAIMIIHMTKDGSDFIMENKISFSVVELVLATPCAFYFGRRFFVKAFFALRHINFTMDTLIAVGVGGAYIFSVVAFFICLAGHHVAIYFDTCATLITFMLLGKYLEAIAKSHTSSALVALLKLSPTTALLVREDEVVVVPASSLVVGDVVRVLAGEKVPMDGQVIEGVSEVDESLVTGESVPKPVGVDSHVVGGTINLSTVISVRATRVGDDTVLAQIVRIVQEAQNTKPAIQRVADRIAGVFVPIVLFVSCSVFVVWMVLGNLEAYNTDWQGGDGWVAFAFNRFLSTLVVACPCALGLATPTAIMVGTGIGAEKGILAKSGIAFEVASAVKCIIFDKTGTLTHGKLEVVSTYAYKNHMSTMRIDPDVASCIAAIESQSTHPVAKAIAANLYANGGATPNMSPSEVAIKPGCGVNGKVGDHTVHVGSMNYIMSVCTTLPEGVNTAIDASTRDGLTLVASAIDGELSAVFLLADEPKNEARWVVEELTKKGYIVMMVTGDSMAVAGRIAKDVHIQPYNVVSCCLPAQKVEVVRRMQTKYKVAFVGDGVNDSPALAQSDVGIAVGNGTDVAIETADAVLMKDSLVDLLTFFKLCKVIVQRIHINFCWAFTYNLAMIPVAAGILYPGFGVGLPPIVAGIAMIISSLSVLCSSLALRCFRPVDDHKIITAKKSNDQQLHTSEKNYEMQCSDITIPSDEHSPLQ